MTTYRTSHTRQRCFAPSRIAVVAHAVGLSDSLRRFIDPNYDIARWPLERWPFEGPGPLAVEERRANDPFLSRADAIFDAAQNTARVWQTTMLPQERSTLITTVRAAINDYSMVEWSSNIDRLSPRQRKGCRIVIRIDVSHDGRQTHDFIRHLDVNAHDMLNAALREGVNGTGVRAGAVLAARSPGHAQKR